MINSNFDTLPPIIIREIFSHLSFSESQNISQVCKKFRDIIYDSTFVMHNANRKLVSYYTHVRPLIQTLPSSKENCSRVICIDSATGDIITASPSTMNIYNCSNEILQVKPLNLGVRVTALASKNNITLVGLTSGSVNIFKKDCADSIIFDEHIYGILTILIQDDVAISAGSNSNILLWDIESKNVRQNYLSDKYFVSSLAIQGDVLLSGGSDKTIRIWDAREPGAVGSLTGHTECIKSISYEDNLILSSSADKSVRLWDIRTFKCLKTELGLSDPVKIVSLQDRTYIYNCDNKIFIKDLFSHKELQKIDGKYPKINNMAIGRGIIAYTTCNDDTKILNFKHL